MAAAVSLYNGSTSVLAGIIDSDQDVNSFMRKRDLVFAFCMGLHDRLGESSLVRMLDDSIVERFIVGEIYQDARDFRTLRIFKGVFNSGDFSNFVKSEVMKAAGIILKTTDKLKVCGTPAISGMCFSLTNL
jgi:hypothetical protein